MVGTKVAIQTLTVGERGDVCANASGNDGEADAPRNDREKGHSNAKGWIASPVAALLNDGKGHNEERAGLLRR